MNYTLQVLKGRSDVTALRLIDGVNSVGRHDDCVIRIRSSQVSRRHCEIFEAEGRLMVRDLGSSNGTYVNGLRVLGQQPLKVGDVVTIGGVALRVDPIGGEAPPRPSASPTTETSENDEVVVDAVEIDEADDDADDFEVSLATDDEEGFQMGGGDDAIPLDDAEPAAETPASKPAEEATADFGSGDAPEDDAIAQFLTDLKLDDED